MAGPHDRHFSWLMPTFAVTNIALFVLTMYLNNCPSKSSDCVGANSIGRFAFQSTRENPLLGPSSSTLQRLGALEVKKVVVQHQIWRMFTCMWLHGGLVHVLVNMISLLFVGIRLEQEFGFVRIGLLYIISGIGGSLLSALFIRTTISVGASGALFGLLGAMLSELLTNWSTYSNKCSALISLVLIIALNLAMGILPRVDNFAHIGGFVTGFLLGFVLLIRPQYAWLKQKYSPSRYFEAKSKSKYKCYQYVLLVIALVILIAGFAVGFVLLIGGVDGNEHCSWCHYLKCVPNSLWSCDPQKQAYCESTMTGDQLKLKCLGNGKTNIYMLQGNNSTSHLQELCSQLCR